MKNRFRLIHRGERGGLFYCVDSETGKRWSLKTKDRDDAEQIILAKNQALRQPALNLQIAKAYLAGTDNGVATRTWQQAIEALTNTKQGANKDRWLRVDKDPALIPLLAQIIIETKAEALLKALQAGMELSEDHIKGALRFSWCHMTPETDWQHVVKIISSLR